MANLQYSFATIAIAILEQNYKQPFHNIYREGVRRDTRPFCFPTPEVHNESRLPIFSKIVISGDPPNFQRCFL